MLTKYHAKYFAYELTKRCPSDSIQKLMVSLADAQVDINPYQVKQKTTVEELFRIRWRVV